RNNLDWFGVIVLVGRPPMVLTGQIYALALAGVSVQALLMSAAANAWVAIWSSVAITATARLVAIRLDSEPAYCRWDHPRGRFGTERRATAPVLISRRAWSPGCGSTAGAGQLRVPVNRVNRRSGSWTCGDG
ncbi:MAG: hypothetical protein ACR2OH_13920, partial [Microthrixaceae bacterium]